MNKIIAIDPGYDRCGVAILSNENNKTNLIHSFCIKTNKKDAHEKRLRDIFLEIEKVIKKENPTHLALETLFFSVNKKTALKVAEARGVISVLAGIYNIPLVEVSPQQVKIAMTGVGNANKEQVQKMVKVLLGLDTSKKIDDELDAIAVGFAAGEEIRVSKIFSLK